jgi:CMP/dCMP kinase
VSSPPFVIALDGPAASGKSTVGAGAADALGFFYLDTGLLYRALTWAALQRGVALDDAAALADLAWRLSLVVSPPPAAGQPATVRVDGQDVSDAIHGPAVDAAVSPVSAHALVRDALRAAQRAAIRPPGTILAGRDIGTVVAPDAQLKVWLAASPQERARRRARQTGAEPAAVLAGIAERDRLDRDRAVAPMRPAADAVVIDTDRLAPDQVIRQVVDLARRLGA